MNISEKIKNINKEVITWRHELHANPELCYEENWTAEYIAEKLKSFGIEVHNKIGKTGVIGVLKGSNSQEHKSNRSIGLRADMDALPIEEENDFDYKSKFLGKMHACGHDGHVAMLLGAAKILSKEKKLPDIIGQILFYPWVDFTMSRPSMSINLDGLIVKKSTLDYFADHYLNKNDEITNWKISPLLYSDFYGMPITYIYGAGLDPLVDEGYALMKRLKSFENEVYYKVYEGQMHAFVSNIVSLPTSIDCINEASKAIKKIIQIN